MYRANSPMESVTNQVELVVHGITRARSSAGGVQAAVDQVGLVLDLLQLEHPVSRPAVYEFSLVTRNG